MLPCIAAFGDIMSISCYCLRYFTGSKDLRQWFYKA
jgi:hypothetical protein